MNNILCKADTEQVEQILIRELDVPAEQLVHGAHLKDDLGADSLTLVEIAMAVEDQFNISMPDDRWDTVGTVGELFEALAELLQDKNRPGANGSGNRVK